jgi:hypothetical protein
MNECDAINLDLLEQQNCGMGTVVASADAKNIHRK